MVSGSTHVKRSYPLGNGGPPLTGVTPTTSFPGAVEMLLSHAAKAGGTPPISTITSSPGEIPAGPGRPLLRVSLPNRLEFNVELAVRTDPQTAGDDSKQTPLPERPGK